MSRRPRRRPVVARVSDRWARVVHPRRWTLAGTLRALVLAAVLVCPLVALIRGVADDWAPYGDDATVVLRSLGVTSGDLPLTGMRSTSGADDPALSTHHLGPVEMYLLAIPLALLGGSPFAVLLGCTVTAAAASLLAVVWARRLGGELVMLLVGAGVVLTQWAVGPEVMYRPLNPFFGVLPTLLLLVLATAHLCGRTRALVPLVMTASLIAQSNLAFAPFVVAVVALLVVAAVVRRAQARRTRRGADTPSPARRHVVLAVLAGLVVWTPSIVELYVHDRNNVVQLLRWMRAGEGTPSGIGRGWEQIGFLAPLPGGFRTYSIDLIERGSTPSAVVGAAVLLLLMTVAGHGLVWRRHDGMTAMAVVAVVANLALLGTAAVMPEWPAAPYWLMHWIPVAAFSWAGLAWVALDRWSSVEHLLPDRVVLPAGGCLLVASLILATLLAPAPLEDGSANVVAARRVAESFGPGDGRAIRVHGIGFIPLLGTAPAVAYELDRAGWEVHYLVDWPQPEDAKHLWLNSAPAGAQELLISTAKEPDMVSDLPAEATLLGTVPLDDGSGQRLVFHHVPGAETRTP